MNLTKEHEVIDSVTDHRNIEYSVCILLFSSKRNRVDLLVVLEI